MKHNQRTIIYLTIAALTMGAGIYIIMQNISKTTTYDNTNLKTAPSTVNESATYKKYASLKGEAYDKAFLSGMTVYHSVAMNMGEQAGSSTNREEILNLTAEMSEVQGRDMVKMMDLQTKFGYPVTNGHDMSNMGTASASMDDMSTMNEELQGLSNEAFDKKFLEFLIIYHQDSIDMSRPAQTNAESQEVKDLARNITASQRQRIDEMKRLQVEWGFVEK